MLLTALLVKFKVGLKPMQPGDEFNAGGSASDKAAAAGDAASDTMRHFSSGSSRLGSIWNRKSKITLSQNFRWGLQTVRGVCHIARFRASVWLVRITIVQGKLQQCQIIRVLVSCT